LGLAGVHGRESLAVYRVPFRRAVAGGAHPSVCLPPALVRVFGVQRSPCLSLSREGNPRYICRGLAPGWWDCSQGFALGQPAAMQLPTSYYFFKN